MLWWEKGTAAEESRQRSEGNDWITSPPSEHYQKDRGVTETGEGAGNVECDATGEDQTVGG